MLVAATNPCRCGYAGVPGRCRCSPRELARYRRRLSGPLLDRIDLYPRVGQDGEAAGEPLTSSARAREAVIRARERQASRFAGSSVTANAHMDERLLREHARLDDRAEGMLLAARSQGYLSVRAQHRAIRVARTIADLAGSDRVEAPHLERALALRPQQGIADDVAP
jgi:magnesium chelatase family protein